MDSKSGNVLVLLLLVVTNDVISVPANDVFSKDLQKIASGKEFPEIPPREVAEKEVTFTMFTRQVKNKIISQKEIKPVDSSKPVKIITHGWNSDAKNPWFVNITNAYLKKGDYNVITVDWSALSHQEYAIASSNTRGVGDIIGRLIVKLNREKNMPLKNFHIIGHSLGAHVSGFAAKSVTHLTGSKIWRVTGLDAARPLFELPKQSKGDRLSDEDATIVECVHTAGGVLGFKDPLGTIDFFPNGGGPDQPGCEPPLLSCSHGRSQKYYLQAVQNGGIQGTECESWEKYKKGECKGNKKALLATDFSPNTKGNYYFEIVE